MRSDLLLAIAVAFGATSSQAAVYYWDTNGPAAGVGSVSTPFSWLTNSWATGSTGLLATAAWPDNTASNAHQATFTGTAGTINLPSDVFVNVLRFETANQTPNTVIASTGGALRLTGASPVVNLTLPASNDSVTITAPILSQAGFTLDGNSNAGGFKFLVLENASAATPNAFGGPLTIAVGGALRIGGGAREQVPDNVDLNVAGVIDFVTVGGASDMKQEKVRDVTVTGAGAIFSVGNGTDFVVNSLSATDATNVSVNGNQATVPGRLIINGWSNGAGHLSLNSSLVKLNTTSGQAAIGGRVLLAGNITSTGASQVINNNGGPSNATPAQLDDNVFTHRAFDWTSAAHTIHVADGTLSFTSRAPSHPLEMTSTNPGGTTLTKTGAGVLLYEHATQVSFTGVNRVEAGTLRIGANERLANGSALHVAGGTLDLQAFNETVASVQLDGGSITGSGVLTSTSDFQLRAGAIGAKLGGVAGLLKTTSGAVQLTGNNTYSGDTRIAAGALSLTQPFLANGADVYLVAGGVLDLAFGAGVTDAIEALFFDGAAQAPGVWGPIGSGATFETSFLTGTGKLVVGSLGLAGDFDRNGAVNAADLLQWQGDFGVNDESDANGDGRTDGLDFVIWQRNVGLTASTSAAAPVPEPSAAALGAVGIACAGAFGSRRPKQHPMAWRVA
ncbi:MAG TPA: hypothetical protein VEQ85_01325 [Lacipirellulaceae bacterium]|nr:hypothetical protein [Lacipirellulaceae bacterium]